MWPTLPLGSCKHKQVFSQPSGKMSILDIPVPPCPLRVEDLLAPPPPGTATQLHTERQYSSPAPPMETNFYTTGINPAGRLQCRPDALGSCDYNEVLGTDSGREGAEHWLCHCPDPLPSRHARDPGSGAREGPLATGPTLTQASCRWGLHLPSERLALREWAVAGSEGGEVGPALPLWLGPSRLDDSRLLASLPAASL